MAKATAVRAIRFQAQSSGIDIDRAGIVEGDAQIGKRVILLVEGATVVKGAIACHPVGKGIRVGKGAGIVEGAIAEEVIVPVGTGVTTPGGVAGIHGAPTRDGPASIAAHGQRTVKCGGGSTRNGAHRSRYSNR